MAIDMEYNRIPEPLKNSVVKYSPNSSFGSHLEAADNAVENYEDDVVAVHIRTWNTRTQEEDFKRYDKLFSMPSYLKELDKLSDRRFFVATDDQDVVRFLETIWCQ